MTAYRSEWNRYGIESELKKNVKRFDEKYAERIEHVNIIGTIPLHLRCERIMEQLLLDIAVLGFLRTGFAVND